MGRAASSAGLPAYPGYLLQQRLKHSCSRLCLLRAAFFNAPPAALHCLCSCACLLCVNLAGCSSYLCKCQFNAFCARPFKFCSSRLCCYCYTYRSFAFISRWYSFFYRRWYILKCRFRDFHVKLTPACLFCHAMPLLVLLKLLLNALKYKFYRND